MLNFRTEVPSRWRRLVSGAVILTLAAAVTLLAWPDAIEVLTGIAPEPRPSAPDDLAAAASDNPLPFLSRRDVIQIRVPEATTLRQFLDRNRLNKDTQVKQIAEQLGSAAPDTPIAAGTTFTIQLTPTTPDVPGTKR
ncbi:MAG TPA: hypothetical protein VHL59_18080 [Thermoanaerobaculia bacterium]|nr:hypothetical protein [Thermoanaerobaculia bacterium]